MYKARSITSKASSACKMNMGLVEGEREINSVEKADLGKEVGGQFKKEGGQASKSIAPSTPPATDTDTSTDTDTNTGTDTSSEEAPTPNKKKYY